MLQRSYPHIPWETVKQLAPTSSKKQIALQNVISHLFGKEVEILSNWKHPDLRFTASNSKMEIDIFIPSLSLGFEFQGTLFLHLASTLICRSSPLRVSLSLW
jgi:hypothetical protein